MMTYFSKRSSSLLRSASKKPSRRRRFGFEPLEARAMLSVTAGDFNGDGRDDLAVGVSHEDLPAGLNANGKIDAGAVNVIYGGQLGLTATGNQFWNQDSSGINGVAADSDQFGEALAAGDFNGDGFDDLAIGVPGDDVSGISAAGSVNVLYGSVGGLRASGDQLWNQNSPGINGVPEGNDQFGRTLVAGDFDGDGFDDLAIEVPVERVGAILPGAVNVIYGSSTGLNASGDQLWHQNVPGINGVAEASNLFGNSLAAGDFNHDGRDDLAIGVSQDKVAGFFSAGAVNVIYGSASGLTASGDQLLHQDTTGIGDAPEFADHFGSAVAAGDLNGDGFDDLAVGVVQESGTIGSESFSGMLHVLFGSGAKLSGTGSQVLTRLDFGMPASILVIGEALAIGDFNHDGFDDLSIGASFADVSGVSGGSAIAAYGSISGVDSSSAQIWNQSITGILETPENGDRFGSDVATGDFDGDGRADLVVTVPKEDLSFDDAGLVHVIYGFLTGLTSLGNQTWAQGVNGILGDQEFNDQFGL